MTTTGIELASFIVDFLGALRYSDPTWRKNRIDELADIKRRKLVHDAQIEQDLALLKVKFKGELERAHDKEAHITRDYKEMLQDIEEMKIMIMQQYPEMPKPMARLVHHHARELIDEMWKDPHNPNLTSRTKLVRFLKIVYSDTQEAIIKENNSGIPTRTIDFLTAENT